MNPTIPNDALGAVFACAPLVLGIVIYASVWLAKRSETGEAPVPVRATYACASCGKRGIKEHMVPQTHEGAVSYYCAHCA